MPISIGIDAEAMPARDSPLMRSEALPIGTPLPSTDRSMVPETRPLTSKLGQTMLSSDSDTRSSLALIAVVSPKPPDTTSLPSVVMTVTGASVQPLSPRSMMAGPDRVIGRLSIRPFAVTVMRSGSNSAATLASNVTSARPLAMPVALPLPLAKTMLPLVFSIISSPRRTSLSAKLPVMLGPLAGSSTASFNSPASMVTGVTRSNRAWCAVMAMSAR